MPRGDTKERLRMPRSGTKERLRATNKARVAKKESLGVAHGGLQQNIFNTGLELLTEFVFELM